MNILSNDLLNLFKTEKNLSDHETLQMDMEELQRKMATRELSERTWHFKDWILKNND